MIQYEVALEQLEIFVLILMRIASFIYVAPFFNTANVPRRTKIGLAFFVTVLVYSVKADMTVEYSGIIGYAVVVLQEVAVGLILGAMASFCVQIIMFAGKMIDMDTGLAMAQIMDPTTNVQVGIFGNFYYYILLLLLMVSGLYRYLISAIVETYNVIPIGQVKFSASIYNDIIGFMSDYFVIGFRIALPVFSAILLLNVLARIAPQMNMFVVGMQLKIFVGIFAVFFTIVMMPAVSTFIEDEIKTLMASLVRGMSP